VQIDALRAETSNMQSPSWIVRASGGVDGVVARRFGRETLLVPVCGGVGDLDSVYTLNEVGTTIWDALAVPTSITSLVDTIVGEYDVTAEHARRDVDGFLADLDKLGLVQAAAAESRT
jgi:hypothetical protein